MSVSSTSIIFGDNKSIIISKFEITQKGKNNNDKKYIKNEDKTTFILNNCINDNECGALNDNICIVDQFSGEKKNFRKNIKHNSNNKDFKLGFLNLLNSIEQDCEFIIPIYSDKIPGNYCYDGIEAYLDNYIIEHENLKIIFMLNNEAIEYIGKCYSGFDFNFNNYNEITYHEIGNDFLKNYSEKNNITIILSELTINNYIKSISNKKRKFEEINFDTLHVSCSGEKVNTFVLKSDKFICDRIGGENSDIFPTYVKLSSEENSKDKDIKSSVVILFILDSDNMNDIKIKCQYNGNYSSISYNDIEKYNKKNYKLNDFYNEKNLDFNDFNTLVNLSKNDLKMTDFHNLDDELLKKISFHNDFFNHVRSNMFNSFCKLIDTYKDPDVLLKKKLYSSNSMIRNATHTIPMLGHNISAFN